MFFMWFQDFLLLLFFALEALNRPSHLHLTEAKTELFCRYFGAGRRYIDAEISANNNGDALLSEEKHCLGDTDETASVLVLNAAGAETPRCPHQPGCCAAGWLIPTRRRLKICSVADPSVSFLFARLDSLRFYNRSSTGKTTSRGKTIRYNWRPLESFRSQRLRIKSKGYF